MKIKGASSMLQPTHVLTLVMCVQMTFQNYNLPILHIVHYFFHGISTSVESKLDYGYGCGCAWSIYSLALTALSSI